MFIDSTATTTVPTALVYTIDSIDTDKVGSRVVNFNLKSATGAGTFKDLNYNFVQTGDAVTLGIGVQPYGSIIIPASVDTAGQDVDLSVTDGVTFYDKTLVINANASASPAVASELVVGADITFTKRS